MPLLGIGGKSGFRAGFYRMLTEILYFETGMHLATPEEDMVKYDERRLVMRMLARWTDIKGDRPMPALSDIDPQAIGEDWRCCAIVAVGAERASSRLSHVGADLAPEGDPAAGKEVREIAFNTLLGAAAANLDWVLDRKAPLSLGGEMITPQGPFLYRYILLPLSEDGARPDHILIVANGRAVAAGATAERQESAESAP